MGAFEKIEKGKLAERREGSYDQYVGSVRKNDWMIRIMTTKGKGVGKASRKR